MTKTAKGVTKGVTGVTKGVTKGAKLAGEKAEHGQFIAVRQMDTFSQSL